MNIKDCIIATKQEFENSFSSGEFYNKQTQDQQHLKSILSFLPIKEGMNIFDLGAGSGYLTFPLAKANLGVSVIGLDIVEKALAMNQDRAEKENISNILFRSYDGINFPFTDNEFDMLVSRYALHHFPDIHKSISEVSRVIKKGGYFFVSDPCPNTEDAERFVDKYMQLKKDGHIKFYTQEEWITIAGQKGLELVHSFDSSIRFPKKKDTAMGDRKSTRLNSSH